MDITEDQKWKAASRYTGRQDHLLRQYEFTHRIINKGSFGQTFTIIQIICTLFQTNAKFIYKLLHLAEAVERKRRNKHITRRKR